MMEVDSDGWMDGQIDGQMDGRTDGWMDGWIFFFTFYSFFVTHLKNFPCFEEASVLRAAQREQDVERHHAVLLLKHKAVSVLGGPRGAHRGASTPGVAAALSASIFDQTLLPPGERNRRD